MYMLITIDPYYPIEFFNQTKEALKNNEVEYSVALNIKPPYNWYFNIDKEPIMVDYDKATNSEERWIINAVNPLRSNDAYLLQRRNNDNGPKALLKFVENEPMKKARVSDYAVFFTVSGKDELEKISKEYPGTIWYLGKYYNNKFRVCLAVHESIKAFLSLDQILLEKKKDLSEPGRFEAELNWKIFRGNDALVKFTETPYVINGKMTRPKIQGEHSSRFII